MFTEFPWREQQWNPKIAKRGAARFRFASTAADNLIGSAVTACDRAMDRAIAAGSVCRFSSEKQRVLHRRGQGRLCPVASDFAVAVGPTGKRVSLPVMNVSAFQPVLKLLKFHAKKFAQSLQAAIDQKRGFSIGQFFG